MVFCADSRGLPYPEGAPSSQKVHRTEGRFEIPELKAEFVLDSSLTMAWCFEDEASPETDDEPLRKVAEAAGLSLLPAATGPVL